MVNLDAIEERIRKAEREMGRIINEQLCPPFIGPPEKPHPIPLTTRLRWHWYAIRERLAVYVLRVDIHEVDIHEENGEW